MWGGMGIKSYILRVQMEAGEFLSISAAVVVLKIISSLIQDFY